MSGLNDSSLIVQFMTLVEDFTPIKPLSGLPNGPTKGRNDGGIVDVKGNAMSIGGIFHLNHNQVMLLVGLGVIYAIVKMITG